MESFRLNPDREHVMRIVEGIMKKNGHCPCQVKEDETTLCPCNKFIEKQECCCKLYVKEE